MERVVVKLQSWETCGGTVAQSPMWKSEDEAWSEDESVSSSGSREGNVCNDALNVIGLCGPGGKMKALVGASRREGSLARKLAK